MATTIQPPQVESEERESLRHSGGGGRGHDLVPADGPAMRSLEDRPGEPTRTGIWVALCAIAMTFAALVSALYVREGSATDWHHIPVPPILYFNTFILIVSSFTLEGARRRVAAFMRGEEHNRAVPMSWLGGTLVLGVVFICGQYLAWLQLRAMGLFLATNPNSSFFYLLTAVHAIHVLGGLGGLIRVIVKFIVPKFSLRRSTMDATSYYWHFMGVLWVFLLFVVWSKL